MLPLDLHVLGLPPAFNLSHDQTLQFKVCRSNKLANKLFSHSFNLISFGYQHSQTSAHTDCLINFLKSASLRVSPLATGSELFRNPVLLSRKCFAFSQEPIFITAGQSVICITAAVSVGSHYRAFCGGRKREN